MMNSHIRTEIKTTHYQTEFILNNNNKNYYNDSDDILYINVGYD